MSNDRDRRGSLFVKNALVVNEGECYRASIQIEYGYIAAILSPETTPPAGMEIIDATGLWCLPGVIDDQVHFRDPGLTHKGDIETESKAALFGGVTSYMEMPNTKPQTVTMEAWHAKMNRAENCSYANYAFYMGATNNNADILRKMDLQHTPGVKVFMGSSTGNMLVDNEETLRRIFAESPILIAVHSESEEVIKANKERVLAEFGADPDVSLHPVIRDAEACYRSTEKAIRLALETGARLHILHISTAKELPLFEVGGSLKTKKITCEVCVHHLWFTSEEYKRLGTRIKWNPAVKSLEDREALRLALQEHRIDVIATDHAPHLLSEKEGGALTAASGCPATFAVYTIICNRVFYIGLYQYKVCVVAFSYVATSYNVEQLCRAVSHIVYHIR